MSDPTLRMAAAAELVDGLLRQRLRAAGISPEPPERYWALEPGPPAPWSAGTEVRVATWRHWGTATAYGDDDEGDVEGWALPALAEPPAQSTLSLEEALAAVATAVGLPEDAEIDSFYHYDYAGRCRLARLECVRVHQGMRVVADQLVALVHPDTRLVVDYFRKWRELRIVGGPLRNPIRREPRGDLPGP